MKKSEIKIYDTTLRDGSQMQGVSFSVSDKIRILKILDDLGVHYIEGGWPGANPKDIEFFQKAKKIKLKNSQLVAFGCTKKITSKSCAQDEILNNLLEAETQIITIVGKTWDLHVEVALKTSLEENLKIISESIKYLKNKNKTVFFDAEHFFDGFTHNKNYAVQVVKTAFNAGADSVVLCDTNGGSLPEYIQETIKFLIKKFPDENFGIHVHNDGNLAVANSLVAIKSGVKQVQGTINGYGERCGNADLVSIICNLQLKLKEQVLTSENLKKITHVSRVISEIANLNLNSGQPFSGRNAFRHKGGLHASAMCRDRSTYEHINPELIGNDSKVLVSEQAGLSNIIGFAKNYNISLGETQEEINKTAKLLLLKIKEKEHQGYEYEQAEASLVLLLLEITGKQARFFDVIDFRVISSMDSSSEATVQLKIQNKNFHVASLGVGPGHALDQALRKALANFYSSLSNFYLSDFKVRVVDSQDGTAAKTRVSVETINKHGTKWNTVSVSENIIQATFSAIKESIEYGLYLEN